MAMMSTAGDTWGISGPQFLTFYGALCVLVVAWLAWEWRRVVGRRDASGDPRPHLGIYKTAMLSGGPQLTVTTVAAKLGQDGHLHGGDVPGTLVVEGLLPTGADPLEREVFGSVHRSAGISVETLRQEVTGSEPLRHLTQELRKAGLVVAEAAAERLHRLLLIVGPVLAAIGILRAIAAWGDGSESLYLAGAVIAVVIGAFEFARRRPFLTGRGREFVRAERTRRPELRDHASSSDVPYAVALWGGVALWSADPAFASALGLPREQVGSSSRHNCGAGGGCGAFDGGGGGGGCGGGGCGGGG
jgi:uncharacterized protein (TIGR04222 family)